MAAFTLAMGIPGVAGATSPMLEITMPGGVVRGFSVAALLARRDLARIDLSGATEPLGRNVPAVPLAALIDTGKDLTFTATDAFSAELSRTMFASAREHGVTPMIAIEDAPWPRRDGRDIGPFALVWQGGNMGSIAQEQWIDSLAAIAPSAGLALPPARDERAETGLAVFAANCLPCHRLAGIGNGRKGRDLLLPVNTARQLGRVTFRATIRHPRPTPPVSMKGFAPGSISDSDLDALWLYLSSISPVSTTERNLR